MPGRPTCTFYLYLSRRDVTSLLSWKIPDNEKLRYSYHLIMTNQPTRVKLVHAGCTTIGCAL